VEYSFPRVAGHATLINMLAWLRWISAQPTCVLAEVQGLPSHIILWLERLLLILWLIRALIHGCRVEVTPPALTAAYTCMWCAMGANCWREAIVPVQRNNLHNKARQEAYVLPSTQRTNAGTRFGCGPDTRPCMYL
jgi:hypothetical protein